MYLVCLFEITSLTSEYLYICKTFAGRDISPYIIVQNVHLYKKGIRTKKLSFTILPFTVLILYFEKQKYNMKWILS